MIWGLPLRFKMLNVLVCTDQSQQLCWLILNKTEEQKGATKERKKEEEEEKK